MKALDAKDCLLKALDPSDNRANVLSLSAAGWALYHQIAPEALAWEAELLQVLSVTEYRDRLRILDKLDAQLQQP
ncbi:MarR family winged helix-turn-helix transcriptional regulator [Ferrimonas pelagia]|uniref:MarR family transcriptional regulator n=1 Tax=Ferrimonas pelagia TaxID=1177826 RepID=A0ABP9EEB6_9GAMM